MPANRRFPKVRTFVRLLFQGDDNEWEFDPDAVDYILAGVIIAHAEILAVLEGMAAEVYVTSVETLVVQLAEGTITIAEWQGSMAAMIKEQHIISAIAGKGGRSMMTATDWGRTGGRLRFQYERLDKFAHEIMSGYFSPEYVAARSKMYINSTRTAYWDALTQAHKDSGEYTEEKRILGYAEHCADCVYFADMGWQPLGSMPEPGSESVCMTNCQCGKIYR